MVKKIFNLFKKKTKIKTKKKVNKIEKAKIINFVNRSKKNNKIQTEQMEVRKMDGLAKELVDSYYRASGKSILDIGYCSYLILFRVLQRMILHLSYPVYRHYLTSTSKEILGNHKQWMHEFKEWDDAPAEGKLRGEKKEDHENDTFH
jgi:hypothetical protein